MKASDLLVRCLEREGVRYIFGMPGEENSDLMDSLIDSNIEFIGTFHEQAAAFMADVYGRLTGKPGVCLATLGPGATNLMTGIGDAYLDYSPVVAITGQTSLDRVHKEAHQYVDVVNMFRDITKWNQQIKVANTIPEIVRKGFKISTNTKPGPVHIELPEDIAKEETEGEPLPPTSIPRSAPDENEVEIAAQLINEAKRPIILVGNGVIRDKASSVVKKFVEETNIPAGNTFMAKGVLPSEHPLNLFTVGVQERDYVLCGFDRADLIITIGYDFVEYLPKHWKKKAGQSIVHIDTVPAEVDAYYAVEAELVGNTEISLHSLLSLVTKREVKHEITKLQENLIEKLHAADEDSGSPVKPQRILSDLKKAEKGDAIVISDVGAHKLWVARTYQPEKPNHTIISNGWASMGIAIPGAMAAKLSNPDKPVVAITGDSGFMINSAELANAKEMGLAFVVIIFNDSKLGLIEWKQLQEHNRTHAIKINNPDFLKYAESVGAKGVKVEHSDELFATLDKAIHSDEITLIDVDVDSTENEKLTEELGDYICQM